MAKLASSFVDGQKQEIFKHHSLLQSKSRRRINLSEAILHWIVSGSAETYRQEYFVPLP